MAKFRREADPLLTQRAASDNGAGYELPYMQRVMMTSRESNPVTPLGVQRWMKMVNK